MEINKSLLIFGVILLSSCSLFMLETDGWDILKTGDVNAAHKEFLRDYAYDSDSVRYSAGLAYTYFLMGLYDSSLIYVERSDDISSTSVFTVFSSLVYYNTFNFTKADTLYRAYIDREGILSNEFIIDSFIRSDALHKLGLICTYKTGDYLFVYDILLELTNIPDDLIMPENAGILTDYIESL